MIRITSTISHSGMVGAVGVGVGVGVCCTVIDVLTTFGAVDGATGVAVNCCAVIDADSMSGVVDTVMGEAVSC
jgi:hypothetical protein